MQMGMAALLPGMQHMIDLMQRALNEMRAELAALQNGSEPAKRGRPRKAAAKTRSGWSADPEERSREMKRRLAVAKEKSAKTRWRKKIQKTQKALWDNLSARERKKRLATLKAAREKAAAAKKQLPVTKLAVAS